MSDWKEIKLGDLGTVVTGKTPSKNNPEYWGNETLFITPSDYGNYRKWANDSIRKLSADGSENLSNKVLPVGSILVTCIGSDMGKVVMNRKDAITNQQINSIIPNTDVVNPDFAYYLLVDLYETLRIYGGDGTAVPIVNKGDFEKIDALIPEKDEQNAIAEVLSSLDDKIDLLHRQNQTLEQMAETLFRQWFVENPKPEWEERPLSSIATFLNGLACQKFPPQNDVDKLPVLKIKELRNGISEDCDWCTTEVDEKYIVENGDVIFSWSASLMVKIWDGETCILNQHLFKVTSDEFPKWYFYLWSKYHLAQFIAIATAHATTMGHIKRGDLDEAMVLVPAVDEIEMFAETIEPIIDKIVINNRQISKLVALRDTLLPKLISGEIRVSNSKEKKITTNK